MKLGSIGMSMSHWYAIVALSFAPGAEEGHGTAQRARVKVGFYPRDTRAYGTKSRSYGFIIWYEYGLNKTKSCKTQPHSLNHSLSLCQVRAWRVRAALHSFRPSWRDLRSDADRMCTVSCMCRTPLDNKFADVRAR